MKRPMILIYCIVFVCLFCKLIHVISSLHSCEERLREVFTASFFNGFSYLLPSSLYPSSFFNGFFPPPTHPSLEGSGPDCVCHLWLDRRGAAWVWDQSIIQSENGSVGPRQAGRSLMELLTRPCGLLDNDTVAEPSLQKSQLPRREVTTELIR